MRPLSRGELLVEAEAIVLRGEAAELVAEDDLVGLAGRVQQDDVGHLAALVEVAQHAHDRRDPAAGADEQQLGRAAVSGARTRPRRRPARRSSRASPCRTRYGDTLPSSTCLTVIAMQPVLAVGVRGQRVRAPVADAVDVDADPHVLARAVAGPAVAGLDQDRRRLGGLVLDSLDPPAQLARGPQRVDQLQIVVGSSGELSDASALRTRRWTGWTFGAPPFSGIYS